MAFIFIAVSADVIAYKNIFSTSLSLTYKNARFLFNTKRIFLVHKCKLRFHEAKTHHVWCKLAIFNIPHATFAVCLPRDHHSYISRPYGQAE